jgi:PhzF family phenazine biosynthesis protein
MRIPIYQIDAFTDKVFCGNPAAVCPLDAWLADDVLQAIAAENNLSETAYFVPEGDGYRLRWFTPRVEVDLCGHATLASAYVILEVLTQGRTSVTFTTRSGLLTVERDNDRLAMDFPARPPEPCTAPDALLEGLGGRPEAVLLSRDYFVLYATEAEVRALQPRMDLLETLDSLGVIVTAPGTDCDFVSRFFAPQAGIPEDPATGSSHCTLVPYWSQRLGKKTLHDRQVSVRGGEFWCEDRGERVRIAGKATRYLEGTILVLGSADDADGRR